MSINFEYPQRFKVGDKVIIAKDCTDIEPNNWCKTMEEFQGKIGTIMSVCNNYTGKRMDNSGNISCPLYNLDVDGQHWDWMDPWLTRINGTKIDANGNLE